MGYATIDRKLADGGWVLLDGGTGTEILRRGLPETVALWALSPLLHAPEALRSIHETYIAAGAEVITTATFRTGARALRGVGLEAESERLTRAAVRLAAEARDRSRVVRPVAIAGS